MTSATLQKPWSAQLPLRFAGTRMAISWNSFDRRGDRSFSRFWDGGCSMERTISRILKGHWDHNQWNTAKSSIWFLFIDFGHFGQPVIVSGYGSNQPSHQWLNRLPLTKMLMRWTALGLRFGRMARFPGGAACENTYRIILIEFDAVHVAKCTSMGEIHLLIIIDPIIFCSISFRFFQIMQKNDVSWRCVLLNFQVPTTHMCTFTPHISFPICEAEPFRIQGRTDAPSCSLDEFPIVAANSTFVSRIGKSQHKKDHSRCNFG